MANETRPCLHHAAEACKEGLASPAATSLGSGPMPSVGGHGGGRARVYVSKSENTPAAVRCHVGKNKKRWGDVKKTSKAKGTSGGPSQVDLKSSSLSYFFFAPKLFFALTPYLPTNFRRFLSNYHSNMKLFAFLLVVLVGAAQAFVAPSAFKGTAMTSPRATRGERACD